MMYLPIWLFVVIIFAAFFFGVFIIGFLAASRQRDVKEKLFKLRETITRLGGSMKDMEFDQGD